MNDRSKPSFARRIRDAKPHAKKYELWDDAISGLGLCIRPSGTRTFFLRRNVRGRIRYATIGRTDDVTLAQARREARGLIVTFLGTARKDNGPRTPGRPMDAFAAEFLERQARHWKPATLETSKAAIRNHILPAFGHLTVDALTRERVQDWFASMSGTPGNANRVMPVLSVMMRMAEMWGYRVHNTNPCKVRVRPSRYGRRVQPTDPLAQRAFTTSACPVRTGLAEPLPCKNTRRFKMEPKARILPAFGRMRIDEIGPVEVAAWFDAASRDRPGAANRALEILRAMMFKAEEWGWRERDANPCLGIRKNPRRKVARFLDTDELDRLGRALDARDAEWPDAVAAIRLLALTGCRRGEVLDLQWRDIGTEAIRLPTARPDRAAYLSEKEPRRYSTRFPASGAPTPSCSRDTPKAGGSSGSRHAGAPYAGVRVWAGCDARPPSHLCQPCRHVRREPATGRQAARPPAARYHRRLRPPRRRTPRRSGREGGKGHCGGNELNISHGCFVERFRRHLTIRHACRSTPKMWNNSFGLWIFESFRESFHLSSVEDIQTNNRIVLSVSYPIWLQIPFLSTYIISNTPFFLFLHEIS